MNKQDRKNMFFYGIGTIGRDMFYTLESTAIIYYLSNVLDLPLSVFVSTSFVFTILRVFDALNDPLMGLIIDNGRSKYGKFKKPMFVGAIGAAIFYMVLFTDFGLRDWRFVAVFTVAYLLWDIFYGLNDIAYWSMLPALSLEQKSREKIGAFAKICGNLGMFITLVAWQPVTTSLGGNPSAWFKVALFVTVMMLFFQFITVFTVKEKNFSATAEEKTTLRGMWKVFSQNDQLLWVTLSMSLFTIGCLITTSVSVYYMQYIYGDAAMYAVLAGVVGVSQLTALSIFPLISKHISRKKFYALATGLVLAGYVLFVFADKSLIMIAISALVLFTGQAFIQLLMLMFITDTVEYGQWKLGQRNESITFSAQPLINKIGGALSMGLVSICLVVSGIKIDDVAVAAIDERGKIILKLFMIALPLLLIISGYFIYLRKYRIDEEFYAQMLANLRARGQLKGNDEGDA